MGRSLLWAEHEALGAIMNPQGRALSYPTGVENEHKAVRAAAGLQDLSTLPVITIRGKNSLRLVNFLCANDASKLQDGQLQYTAMLDDNGIFFEDMTIWRIAADNWVLLPVAREKVVNRFQSFASVMDDVYVIDTSSMYGGPVALQGPRSKDVLQKVADIDLSTIKRFWGVECKIAGRPVMVDRAGYTGENGFELCPLADDAVDVWRAVLDAGKEFGLIPNAGGAMGTLRLEKGLIGGREFAGANPFEVGVERFVAMGKKAFMGKEALQRVQAEGGPKRKLVGLDIEGNAPAATGDPVYLEGKAVGKVTSGGYGYTLGKNIGMALLEAQYAVLGVKTTVTTGGKETEATVTTTRKYDPEDKRLRSWSY